MKKVTMLLLAALFAAFVTTSGTQGTTVFRKGIVIHCSSAKQYSKFSAGTNINYTPPPPSTDFVYGGSITHGFSAHSNPVNTATGLRKIISIPNSVTAKNLIVVDAGNDAFAQISPAGAGIENPVFIKPKAQDPEGTTANMNVRDVEYVPGSTDGAGPMVSHIIVTGPVTVTPGPNVSPDAEIPTFGMAMFPVDDSTGTTSEVSPSDAYNGYFFVALASALPGSPTKVESWDSAFLYVAGDPRPYKYYVACRVNPEPGSHVVYLFEFSANAVMPDANPDPFDPAGATANVPPFKRLRKILGSPGGSTSLLQNKPPDVNIAAVYSSGGVSPHIDFLKSIEIRSTQTETPAGARRVWIFDNDAHLIASPPPTWRSDTHVQILSFDGPGATSDLLNIGTVITTTPVSLGAHEIHLDAKNDNGLCSFARLFQDPDTNSLSASSNLSLVPGTHGNNWDGNPNNNVIYGLTGVVAGGADGIDVYDAPFAGTSFHVFVGSAVKSFVHLFQIDMSSTANTATLITDVKMLTSTEEEPIIPVNRPICCGVQVMGSTISDPFGEVPGLVSFSGGTSGGGTISAPCYVASASGVSFSDRIELIGSRTGAISQTSTGGAFSTAYHDAAFSAAAAVGKNPFSGLSYAAVATAVGILLVGIVAAFLKRISA